MVLDNLPPPPNKKINIVDMSRICDFSTGCLHLKQHNEYGQKYACIFIYNGYISNLTFEIVNMCSTTLLTIFHLYPYSQFICKETFNLSGKNHPLPQVTVKLIIDTILSSIFHHGCPSNSQALILVGGDW